VSGWFDRISILEFVMLMLGLPLVFFLLGPLTNDLQGPSGRRMFFAFTGIIAGVLVILGLSISVSAGKAWPILGVAALLVGKANLYFHPPRTKLSPS
jgi:hypothetical protein